MFSWSAGRRTRWALALVVILEAILFGQQRLADWGCLKSVGTPQTLAGEGLVIRSDGLGYYAWLRSLLIDGDWSFDNEFDNHNALGSWVPPSDWRSDLDRRLNPWSVGPAWIWAVSVIPGHLAIQALQARSLPWAADGYSLPYQLLVGGTTLLAAFLGLAFLYAICRRYARPTRAALAAVLLTLGTTMVYYNSVEVSMAHGLGSAVLAGLVWYWLTTYGSEQAGRWLLIGVLLGVAALVRWQLAGFALLPFGEAALAAVLPLRARPRRLAGKPLLGLGLAAGAAVVAFAPQMLAWHVIYGRWLGSPMPLSQNWLHPSWWEVLGSTNRSFFYWTPLTLVATVGYLACRPGRRRFGGTPGPDAPAMLLFGAFLFQIYTLASIRGPGVFLGSAFGYRQLTEALVALAPGLALLLEGARPRVYRALCAVGCGLVFWNLVLVYQYCHYLLPLDGGANPAELFRNLLRVAHAKPLALLGLSVGPAALGLLLGSAPRPGT